MEWTRVNWSEPEWTGVNQSELEWTRVNWSESGWTGVSQSELEWRLISMMAIALPSRMHFTLLHTSSSHFTPFHPISSWFILAHSASLHLIPVNALQNDTNQLTLIFVQRIPSYLTKTYHRYHPSWTQWALVNKHRAYTPIPFFLMSLSES